jgi:very-short-patch-repair endonuclease
MRTGEKKSRSFAKGLRPRLTKAEAWLWKRLKEANQHGYNFRRQHPVGPFIADFAHARGALIVEVDGATHGSDEEVAYDAQRDAYLTSRGWHVLRVSNVEIFSDLDAVVEFVIAHVPPPPRSRRARSAPPP